MASRPESASSNEGSSQMRLKIGGQHTSHYTRPVEREQPETVILDAGPRHVADALFIAIRLEQMGYTRDWRHLIQQAEVLGDDADGTTVRLERDG